MEKNIDLSEYFSEPKPPSEIEKELENLNNVSGELRPWHLVNPNIPKSSEEEANARFEICKSCPELIKVTSTRKKCGCFMFLKTKLKEATCPINKW